MNLNLNNNYNLNKERPYNSYNQNIKPYPVSSSVNQNIQKEIIENKNVNQEQKINLTDYVNIITEIDDVNKTVSSVKYFFYEFFRLIKKT